MNIRFCAVNSRASWRLLALLCPLLVTGVARADLFVSSSGTNSVKRYDETTGMYLGDFVSPGSGGLTNPQGIAFGPDGNLYVSSVGTGSNPKAVLKYNGSTGAFMGVFTTGTVFTFPADITFRPDGYMYVSEFKPTGGTVKRFNATTGVFKDDFAKNISSPDGQSWDLNGDLYVSAFGTGRIMKFNGSTGALINGTWGSGATQALDSRFGADGNLYVNSFSTGRVKKYNGSTGAFISDFIVVGSTTTQGQAIGPDGLLYVGDYQGGSINVYNASSGSLVRSFNGGGLTRPNNFCFTPTPGAGFVSQSVPLTMTAGMHQTVTLVLQNDGTTLWSLNGGYRLASANPTGNTTWGLDHVDLNSKETYEPGRRKTFKFDVLAPEAAGSYDFSWQMMQDSLGVFGVPTPNLSINVVKADRASQFISWTTPPSTMVSGTTSPATVTMKNVGNFTWTGAQLYGVGSRTPVDNRYWGFTRMFMASGDTCAPGDTYTFSRTVTAPWAAGTYTYQWKTIQSGVTWFGEFTPAKTITVTIGPDAATYVSQSVPTSVAAGSTFSASMTLKNTGTNTWTTAGNYRIGSANPYNTTTWGTSRVELPTNASVRTNQTVTFTHAYTAPTTPGVYTFQWRMIHSGKAFFGELTPQVKITVT